MTVAKSAEKRRSRYQRHGLHALKGALEAVEENQRGEWLEELGEAGQVLREWRSALVDDLGGETAVSAQQRAVVELAAKTYLFLGSVDRYLLEQPSLVNKSRRQLFPIVLQRQQLADALARYMRDLGLERRAREATVSSWLSEKPKSEPQ